MAYSECARKQAAEGSQKDPEIPCNLLGAASFLSVMTRLLAVALKVQ